jgi:hypothetical protein
MFKQLVISQLLGVAIDGIIATTTGVPPTLMFQVLKGAILYAVEEITKSKND